MWREWLSLAIDILAALLFDARVMEDQGTARGVRVSVETVRIVRALPALAEEGRKAE